MAPEDDSEGGLGLGGRFAFAGFITFFALLVVGIPWATNDEKHGGVAIDGDPSSASATNCCKRLHGEPTRSGLCFLDVNLDAGIASPGEYLIERGPSGECAFALAPESKFDIDTDRDDRP